jgi:tetratricopeptide (TPR) repeat protein
MQLSLRTPAKRWAAGATVVALAVTYCGVATCRLLADHFSESGSESLLRRAIRLDPGNAEYSYRMGIGELALQSPSEALPWFQSATALNGNSAKYWLDLAATEQLLGSSAAEKSALERALAVDPHTPAIAWQAANLFLADGMTDAAMAQFRTVLENDLPLTGPAIRTAWKIRPDVDLLLAGVVPSAAHTQFLNFLLSLGETAAAEKVWAKIYSLRQEFNRSDLLGYEGYLLAHREVEQASLVWQQAAKLSDIEAYQPSPENLLVNGDFSLDILNGGFDWVHQPTSGVSVALDSSETHSGSRSLRIVFDGPAVSDAGISQLVSVEPNTRYEFAALYKAKDLDGAGAMQFAVHDAYSATSLFASDDLREADFWKNAGGTFTTPADTRLLRVHLIRVPAGRPIRGKLWIDGLRLVQSGAHSGSQRETEPK